MSEHASDATGRDPMARGRKTRIVCVSDSHNQTPKLPPGDVLIHAGDLTNQGSFSELKRTVEWLDRADFAAKLVVAGNHDITLDRGFFAAHGAAWQYPEPQDPDACRRLLTEAASITYLQHEAASVWLDGRDGQRTCFKVFGSPYSPRKAEWAFQYGDGEAAGLWDAVPDDADIVITHTPPQSFCDDSGEGCAALRRTLQRVRPMLAVFGHVHAGRGVQRVRWRPRSPSGAMRGLAEECRERWADPGLGNKKLSLVDLTGKRDRRLDHSGTRPRQCQWGRGGARSDAGPRGDEGDTGPSEAGKTRRASMGGGGVDVDDGRRETCMVNAAVVGGAWSEGGHQRRHKPIVVDVWLPET